MTVHRESVPARELRITCTNLSPGSLSRSSSRHSFRNHHDDPRLSTSTLSLHATVDYSAFPSPSSAAPQIRLERDSSPLPFTSLEPTPTSSRPSSSKRQVFEEAKALYESGLWISKDNPHSAIAHFLQASNVFSELRGQGNRRDKSLWQVGVCYGKIGWGAKKRQEWTEATEAFEEVSLAYFL